MNNLKEKYSSFNSWWKSLPLSYTAIRNEKEAERVWEAASIALSLRRTDIIEECIQACNKEYLIGDLPVGEDIAYNAAVGHCIGTLRVLQDEVAPCDQVSWHFGDPLPPEANEEREPSEAMKKAALRPEKFVVKSGHERLKIIQEQLVAKGVKDVKFTWALDVAKFSLSSIEDQVADFLEAYLRGECRYIERTNEFGHAIWPCGHGNNPDNGTCWQCGKTR